MPLFAWLALAVGPLAKKVLIALGIGVITYAGVNAALASMQAAVIANWSQMAGTTAQLASLFGFSEALGITLGAIAARAALVVVEKLGRIAA